MTGRGLSVLLVAGESSGDLHGAALAREIRSLRPDASLIGAGGERMRAAGVDTFVTLEEIQAFGFAEVARGLGRLRRSRNRLVRALRERRPDVFVPIDFGGMNLRLAATAHAAGVPVAYFVSPQVWAWRTRRVKTIRRVVDRMIVILPFEERFYREHGVAVSYVGHPLVDEAKPRVPRAAFRAQFGLGGDESGAAPLVALLPGSRAAEVRRLFPLQAAAAATILARRPGARFVAAAASAARAAELRELAAAAARAGAPAIAVVEDATDDLLGACDLALVASGTATVQAAIHGAPMVVMYRVTGLEFAIARRMIRVPHIAMVNLIAGRGIVPELVQDDAHPARIAGEAIRLLEDPEARRAMQRELAGVRAALGDGGAARRAAAVVLEVAQRGTAG